MRSAPIAIALMTLSACAEPLPAAPGACASIDEIADAVGLRFTEHDFPELEEDLRVDWLAGGTGQVEAVATDRGQWTSLLDELDAIDPVETIDWQSQDALVIGEPQWGCDRSTWVFDEVYADDVVRSVSSRRADTGANGELGCGTLWFDARILVIDKLDGAESCSVCIDTTSD